MVYHAPERTGDDAMKLTRPWMIAGLMLIAPGAQAQLLGGSGPVGQVVPDVLNRVDRLVEGSGLERLSPARLADRLASARATRVGDLLRRHGDRVELDDRREPARRGVILLTGADAASLDALKAAGFGVESEAVDGLDLTIVRLQVPQGRSLARALKDVRRIAPRAQASADNLYFPGGSANGAAVGILAGGGTVGRGAAGLIDGGVARHPALTGPVEQRGFARGAPRASAHGTAVASASFMRSTS